jgi:hypothetical protein
MGNHRRNLAMETSTVDNEHPDDEERLPLE